MGDCQAFRFVKIDRARRAAMRASGSTAGILPQTVAAEPQAGRIHPRSPLARPAEREAPGPPPRVSGRRRRRRRAKALRRRRDSRAPISRNAGSAAAVRKLCGPRPVRLRNRLSRSESAAMKASPLSASDRPASRFADCFVFRESRIVRFAFRKCLAASLAGAPAEFTFHGTPDAQNRAHC